MTGAIEEYSCDLLVAGAGIAGLTAAGAAAAKGMRVVVVEKADHVGGSAVLSGGFVWRPESYEVLRAGNPDGDPELGRVLVDGHADAIAWIASLGVEMSEERRSSNMGGIGHLVDILGYVNAARRLVEKVGGAVLLEAEVERLVIEDGAVTGGVVVDRDGRTRVRAPWTVLATGGFQGDPELRRQFIGEQAAQMLVRSNPCSDGAGLRLGRSAGGALSAGMSGFYGHVMAYPLSKPLVPGDFLRLAQSFYSVWGIMLGPDGRRFTDESLGHYRNSQALVRLPGARAVIVADEVTRRTNATTTPLKGVEATDLPREAEREGAHVVYADTIGELAGKIAAWGYDAAGVVRSVAEFNAGLAGDPEALTPARRTNRRPIAEPPFFASECQPAITFTHGGVRIDTEARVLGENGEPVPGLLAAGADGAGVYDGGYAGGLSLGAVFGLRAAATAASSPG
ncbi:succinate dehydrogenase/fumarate reductase flavoprotein subunit [Amycolatopsis bartoniae]|uniref:FAD-binding dehydrogenase n=1 Tax=Amycolatopsis bartoniae TaxID=941986 RepID=A0A8H9MAF2_9PSEU|nr:FAD-dependent oxidoreductase [Amycolatopsis bartoniae]MBB2939722.1 succinate dehydrogenase/fumarate reductase flavoprotein subunit [Amycolatopsis bartoniae]TVT06160.1 FAD-binding protein [Amycolatopsis bartoniae]GHF36256.1 FAD-binding dehydrogenase [Amycolatopsis bartoniae]